MNTTIKTGELITWTPWSPVDTGMNSQDFMAFINEKTEIEVDNAFIKGEVIYFDELSTIVVEVKDMTQDMFPFTIFANEVESRFTSIELKNNDPYQRYLCLDTKSMTSLFYYDVEIGYLADAAYDAEGNFVDYDIEGLRDAFTALFASIPYTTKRVPFEHDFQTVIFLVFTLLGQYVRAEVHSARGRADCVAEVRDYVYLFEFKRDGTADEALAQIEEKGYAAPYAADNRKLIRVGVSFDSEKRILKDWKTIE